MEPVGMGRVVESGRLRERERYSGTTTPAAYTLNDTNSDNVHSHSQTSRLRKPASQAPKLCSAWVRREFHL